MRFWGAILGLAVWGLAGCAFADTLVLKSGQRIECVVKKQTPDAVRIDFQGAELTYDMAEVASVERAPRVIEVLMARPEGTKPADGSGESGTPRQGVDPEFGKYLDEYLDIMRKYGPQMKEALDSRNRNTYVRASEALQRELAAWTAKWELLTAQRLKNGTWTEKQHRELAPVYKETMDEGGRLLGGAPTGMTPEELDKHFGKG